MVQEQFDTGPLSWVMAEIREALTHADRLMLEVPEQGDDTRSTTLHHAKSYLHQAHGALQIVDIDGVSIVTETIEEIVDRLQKGQISVTSEPINFISDALNAVLRYLEDLLSGGTHQPVRLFPYYRALLEVIGAERIHPADLFFPALSMQEKIPELSIKAHIEPINYVSIRSRFEKHLLAVLTNKDAQKQTPALQAMHQLIHEIEQAQTSSQAKAFWLVMRAFTEAAAQGKIESQQYVKQIFGRINLQIRRLVDGVTNVPERLLRDALFFIAQVEDPSEFVGQIRKAYQLEHQVPVNYATKTYGQIPAAKLLAAKEQLSSAKNLWGRIANGDVSLADKFSQKMKDLAETASALQSPEFLKLLRELSGISRHAAQQADGGRMGLELATSLLFVESAIDQITHLPAHFSDRADEITARLLSIVSGDEPPAQAAWMGEIAREAQQRQTMTALVGEMQTSLRQVEKSLDEYFREPSKLESISAVDGVLHQIGGALAILDQDDALLAIQHTQEKISQFATLNEEHDAAYRDALYQNVAQNIGAISFFIETLQNQPELAKKKFNFDTEAGLFRTNLLEQQVQKELLPSTELAVATMEAPAVTMEQELAERQKESARLIMNLADEPDNLEIQTQLKDSLASEVSVAAILDDADASARAQVAMSILDQAEENVSATEISEMVALTAPTQSAADTAHIPELPESDEAIDAELLEIFLTEADEVLAYVGETVPSSRLDPSNQEHLTSLRRSFHTLKGSGRMVGLTMFGEAAWSVEQVMNLWLSEAKSGTEALYALLENTAAQLNDWVNDLKTTGISRRSPSAIIAAAERVKAGQEFVAEAVALIAEPESSLSIAEDAFKPSEDMLEAAVEQTVDSSTQVVDEEIVATLPNNEALNFAEEATHDTVVVEDVPMPEDEIRIDAATESDPFAAIEAQAIPDSEVIQATEATDASAALPSLEEKDEIPELAMHDALPSLDEAILPILEDAVVIEAGPHVDNLQGDTASDLQVEEMVMPTSDIVSPEPLIQVETRKVVAQTGEVAETADLLAQATDLTEPAANDAAVAMQNQSDEFAAAPLDDNIKRIGDIEISLPLHTIYMSETDEIVRILAQDIAEWRHEPARHVSRHAVHAAHRLAGTSATVGLAALQELAHSIELVLQRLERHPVVLEQSEFDTIEHAITCAKSMLEKFALAEMADHAYGEVKELEKLLQAIVVRSNAGEDEEFITSTNEKLDPIVLTDQPDLQAQTNQTEQLDVDAGVAESAETVVEETAVAEHESATPEAEVQTDEQIDPETLSSASVDELPAEQIAHADIVGETELEQPAEITLASETETPAVDTAAVDTAAVETADVDTAVETSSMDISGAEPEVVSVASEESNDLPLTSIESEQGSMEKELVSEAPVAAVLPSIATFDAAAPSSGNEIKLNDDLDADLLPVFLEEGNDLLPMVGQLLRSWQSKPDDIALPQSILRLMHTIKGSARMAGAMQLGQHTHDMEARIESLMHTGSVVRQPLLEDLLARHDYSMHLFDRLQNPHLAVEAAPTQALTTAQELDQFQDAAQAHLIALESKSADAPAPTQAELVNITPVMPALAPAGARPVVAPIATAAPAAAAPLVRVRADILDRLVNQAGEVSISRSKLENEVDTLRASLSELTENVNRLRDQLREVEIQAETQITSRMAHSADREFDPLEFDRFTRLQELTRMMAESVSDVASVQQNLNRTIDGASGDLHTQARLTRELQQDLMRVRMIPFASISERLYRVTRQTSKEMDKRVNLDIRGTGVEMDRSVLEKMVGPFEHLLRNAIVHGIESKEQRRASGKGEVGELLIEIRQEGNEVVIHFTDDGQGLNLARIREKAKSVGLLGQDESMPDSELTNMIFESGFSTASEVTELAGRGVGMDVVRSEATSLGGRVSVNSVPGQGAHFTINLPLTLAVTQVVIISAGGKTFAVPSVLVEQVQQLKVATLTAAYNDGAVMWQGNRVPMYYLSTMLGEPNVTPTTQQYSPVLIMKSGSERVAIHVDDILGNREVVVKNIGPQLARMIGIAGATVLGSGDIVLILNPVPLAQRMEHELARNPHPLVSDVAGDIGAVAETAVGAGGGANAAPVQGLRTQHIVMVVDDSLTVRRVTQRLLVREGYQVVLAKDGIDALEQLQSVSPDVMLVDIEMPRMDGFDLTRNVRGDERTSHIPIIMITSRTADKHRNYAAELGVNEYFGKPYREDDLLAAIEGFVGKLTEAH